MFEDVFVGQQALGLGVGAKPLANLPQLLLRDVPAQRVPHKIADRAMLLFTQLLELFLKLNRNTNGKIIHSRIVVHPMEKSIANQPKRQSEKVLTICHQRSIMTHECK